MSCRLRIFMAESRNIYRNLALEEALFRTVPRGEIRVFLWSNDDCVVIGRNQDLFRECRTDVMKELGVLPARRKTGGGAVFHDAGNLNYSFLGYPEECPEEIQTAIVLQALESLEIGCEATGRNDLSECTTGRKVSGTAYLQSGERLLRHGTLMAGVDIERMEACLNVSREKLERHFVGSVHARVVNLNTFRQGLTIGDLQDALIRALQEKLCADAVVISAFGSTSADLEHAGIMKEILDRYERMYRSSAWICDGAQNH